MEDSFCNRVFLKKGFIKCISKKTDTCYIFIGNIHEIEPIMIKIKKNKKNEDEDSFEDINI